jgi:DNA repair protein RadC
MTRYRIPMYKISMIRDGSVCAERTVVARSQDLSPLLEEYFKGHDREEMLAVLLDAKHKIVGLHTVSIGSMSLSIVHPRETFKAAIVGSAAAITLAHNHPSGDPTPSKEDRELTERLKQTGQLLGIPVLDHVVLGDGERYYSFADNGTL